MEQPNGLNAGFVVPECYQGASAPPMNEITNLLGYQHTSFNTEVLKPPTAIGDQFDPSRIQRTIPNFAAINADDVRTALSEFVSENCCYGSNAARELEIRNIVMRSSFHYKLETFTEKRETKWVYERYNGQLIDDNSNGRIPEPWEIVVPPTTPFQNGTKKLEVQNSGTIKMCETCGGKGKIVCKKCDGRGGQDCPFCFGCGRDTHGECSRCWGKGRDRCLRCFGKGTEKCKTCKGDGTVKWYTELTVHWTNNTEDYISDETGLSEQLIKKATGAVAVDERYPRVYPLFNFPDERISTASKGLIDKHLTSFPTERILEQRHKVMIIPVALVYYKWRLKDGCFYVYGLEHKVCFDDYPERYLCGICTIL